MIKKENLRTNFTKRQPFYQELSCRIKRLIKTCFFYF